MTPSFLSRWKPNVIGLVVVVVCLFWLPSNFAKPVLYLMFPTDGSVRWHLVVPATLLTFWGAMSLGRWLTAAPDSSQRPRPGRILLIVVASTIVPSFVAAPFVSKAHWGYYFEKPPVDARVTGATRVLSVTTFEQDDDKTFRLRERFDSVGLKRLVESKHDEAFKDRAVRGLFHAGLVTGETPALSEQTVQSIGRDLLASVELVPPEPGYEKSARLHGDIIEFDGPEGEPLLLVSVCGGEISNDYYPFYEFLFVRQDEGLGPLLSQVRFFFEISGIEGLEWKQMGVAFSVIASMVLLPLTLLVLIVRRAWSGRRPVSLAAGGS